ncbi:MAG: TfoX/Sxy family protein [Clostridiales bacterium]|jgi:TfoX/Sxy family transcriptional regulator of competence genes|nr:TfoX/Sxy family protein [Clostridiales bacterium]
MATKLDTVLYLCEQLADAGEVRYKRMFGEYMIYLDAKPVLLVCDDTVFVKINDTTSRILGADNEKGFPYDGAKEHYVVSLIDDREAFGALTRAIAEATSFPKKAVKH